MVIGTHSGKFHADDVFALAILKQLHPTADVLRSRNPEKLSRCDIVVDVGGGQYDHHTTDKVYRENGIPYASAGLIWKDFGSDFLSALGVEDNKGSLTKAIDEKLLQGIDADDNGYQLEKDIRVKSVSEIIGSFNPPWNSNEEENAAFGRAVLVASEILRNQVRGEVARLQAAVKVQAAFASRQQRELLVLESACPWTDALLALDPNEEVLFVVFPDKTRGYRIQVVPKLLGNFEARKRLPEAWAGKENKELGDIIGINDAIFCHPARFIAGAVSKDSIMKMAELAIQS